MEKLIYEVGDIVKLKKQHPCGSHEWEILRVGADFRLKCTGCGHQIMIARKLVEKNTKELKKPENPQKKGLQAQKKRGIIINRDILIFLVHEDFSWARDQKEVKFA